ncbi:MAG: hypothetical protein HC866_25765 [Leptolyngbyaceae cyanobacterium RU_5_1]|nr:hypothetical protein [Leptolyngbyaceae cyanobacterium RU_5_1]
MSHPRHDKQLSSTVDRCQDTNSLLQRLRTRSNLLIQQARFAKPGSNQHQCHPRDYSRNAPVEENSLSRFYQSDRVSGEIINPV